MHKTIYCRYMQVMMTYVIVVCDFNAIFNRCFCCCVTGIRLRLHRVQPIIYKSICVLSIHDAWHQLVINSVTTTADLPAYLPAHHRELVHGRRRRRGRRRRINAVTTPQDRKRQQQELVAHSELTCRRQVRRRCVLC